ncbi:MAG: hypothetical protein EXS00_01640 [Phycisphaerales bacterium]|nr:hypothetical protein [Phycisphaerales bacterium]
MSVMSARAKIQLVVKELNESWARLHDEWDDPASRAINTRYLEPLALQSKAALGAMDKILQTLHAMRRDCGPSSS